MEPDSYTKSRSVSVKLANNELEGEAWEEAVETHIPSLEYIILVTKVPDTDRILRNYFF